MQSLKTLRFLLLTIVIALFVVTYFHNQKTLALQISELEQSVADLQKQNITLGTGIYAITTQLEEIKDLVQKEPEIIEEPEPVSRGSTRAEPVTMRITAYDLSYASCKKHPDHPEYGITASGVRVKEWYTIAAGPEIPFNTKIFIPYFQDQPNKGIFVVQDRGSAITENCLDVYLGESKYDECMDFGIQYLEVYLLDKEVSL